MQESAKKPMERHPVRLFAGEKYFTCKRYFFWVFGGVKFARQEKNELVYEHFVHEAPLLRQLKDEDMYLQYNKIENLKIAVKRITGVTLFPGQTFSYWKLIGKPTKRKGYLKGMVVQNGTYKAGTGGGICQLASLIYWMTIHTPLTVVERHRHGCDVYSDSDGILPFGNGATSFYNYLDLMIRNDTNQAFQLMVEVGENELKGSWRSDMPPEFQYKVYARQDVIQRESWGGYTRHNFLFRKKYNMDDVLLDDEFVVENHAVLMYEPYLSANSSPVG